MTQDDNSKRVTFLVPEQSWEEAQDKTDHGEMSERLRETVKTVAHGADVAEEERLMDRLNSLREERRELRQDRDTIENQLEEVNRKIERVETRLDELREQEGEYDGVLAMLEADLQDGARVMEGTDKVKRAAKIGDCTPADVIQDLRERNPDIPDMAFRKARGTEEPNWKQEQGAF